MTNRICYNSSHAQTQSLAASRHNDKPIQKDANIVIIAKSGGMEREQVVGTLEDLPYARLNLRFNPFGQFDRNHRIVTAVPRCDWSSILLKLESDRTAIQFIGRAGSGKSTHLLMLARQFPEFHYVYLPEDSRREVPVRKNLMVDEAQRLYRMQRNRLFQFGNRIVIATHKCLARKLSKQGFQVETVSLDDTPGETWLAQSLQRKIDAATRDPSEAVPQLTRQTVLRLINEFGNDIREMERQLYETFYLLNSFRKSMETTMSVDEGSQRI